MCVFFFLNPSVFLHTQLIKAPTPTPVASLPSDLEPRTPLHRNPCLSIAFFNSSQDGQEVPQFWRTNCWKFKNSPLSVKPAAFCSSRTTESPTTLRLPSAAKLAPQLTGALNHSFHCSAMPPSLSLRPCRSSAQLLFLLEIFLNNPQNTQPTTCAPTPIAAPLDFAWYI